MSKLIIELYGETHELEREDHETVLDTALRHNIDAPYACMSGTCNSCQAKVIEGKVEDEDADALTDEEKAAGETLTCVCKPLSDVVKVQFLD